MALENYADRLKSNGEVCDDGKPPSMNKKSLSTSVVKK